MNYKICIIWKERIFCIYKSAIGKACEMKYKDLGIDKVLLEQELLEQELHLCNKKDNVPHSIKEMFAMIFEQEDANE